MNTDLQHGETFGALKVLEKVPGNHGARYRVGCACGYSKMTVRANALMRAGGLRECWRCAANHSSFNRAIQEKT